jgi:serine/threonine-protein kinase mTOR
VAMQREKYPEKIPFRLTRMLINAMEVSGIEGNFRFTCEDVVRVLREHKESVMAVLEAFVYDPLINWRLLKKQDTQQAQQIRDPDSKHENRTVPEASSLGADGVVRSIPRGGSLTKTVETDLMVGSLVDPDDHPSSARSVGWHVRHESNEQDTDERPSEVLNARALAVMSRVSNKLTGRDFDDAETLDIPAQVQRLIAQATSHENLCQCYIGWCPFW